MNKNYLQNREKLSISKIFIILLLVGGLNQFLRGQDLESYDGGRVSFVNPGTEIVDSNSTEGATSNIASYIRILELIDNQYPKNPFPLVFGDADNDGKTEMYRGIYISEQNNFMRVYEFDENLNYITTDLEYYGIPWAIGDINGNGKTDLIIQTGDVQSGYGYLRVYESVDSSSYPTELISEISLFGRLVEYRARLVDADNDGKKEVLFSANGVDQFGTPIGDIRIYEWQDSTLVSRWISPEIDSVWILTKAVADFDGDGKLEIAAVIPLAGIGDYNKVFVYENTSDDNYELTQYWNLPDYNYWFVDALTETNVDGENPELVVGLSYILPGGGTNYEWIIYKAEDDDDFEQWYNTQFERNIFVGVLRHATGDYDGDGLDEIVVDDHPYLKILEYFNGEMRVTWVNEEFNPIYLTSCDIRNDDLMNFAVVNFGPSADTLSFYELNPNYITIVNDIEDGWQLVSVPIIPEDYSADFLFPTATSALFEYIPGSGYEERDTLKNGPGYWVDFESVETLIHSGLIIDSLSTGILSGWNIIGTVSYNVVAADICTDPSGIISSIYRYDPDSGYIPLVNDGDLLKPGIGYWVNANNSGNVILSESCGLQKITAYPQIDLTELDRFIVTDAEGNKQSLFVANIDSDSTLLNIDRSMPPPVPVLGFDARFNGGEIIKVVSIDSGEVDLGIDVESDAYPIVLSWELNPENGIEYSFISDSGFNKISEIKFNNGNIILNNNSIGRIELFGKVSNEYRRSQLPDEYELLQNYPNPFNPETNIKFAVPREGLVTIKLYDMLGSEVATLYSGNAQQGTYTLNWNGKDNNGNTVSSGTYVYRMTAGDFVSAKKMVLVK